MTGQRPPIGTERFYNQSLPLTESGSNIKRQLFREDGVLDSKRQQTTDSRDVDSAVQASGASSSADNVKAHTGQESATTTTLKAAVLANRAPEAAVSPRALCLRADGSFWRAGSAEPCPLLGAVISGRYELEKFISAGSFGMGFKAIDRNNNDRHVFVKMGRPELAATRSEEVVRNEFAVVRALSSSSEIDRSNLVRIIAVTAPTRPAVVALADRTEFTHMIVMELATMDLYWALCKSRRFTSMGESLARFFARQLVSAVKSLHSCGLYHLDIKLENILIVNEDCQYKLKLADFGGAECAEASSSVMPLPPTRNCYDPPEMHSANMETRVKFDAAKVDVWQCATVVLHMLSADVNKKWRNLPQYGLTPLGSFSPFQSWTTRMARKGAALQLSDEVVSLLDHMLALRPHCRAPIDFVEKHPWFHTSDLTPNEIASQMEGRGQPP